MGLSICRHNLQVQGDKAQYLYGKCIGDPITNKKIKVPLLEIFVYPAAMPPGVFSIKNGI